MSVETLPATRSWGVAPLEEKFGGGGGGAGGVGVMGDVAAM